MEYPKAFIFDLDGVLTDTAEFHYIAWKNLAEELGISISREFNEQLKGISRMESLEKILALNPSLVGMSQYDKEQYADKKNNHYRELIKRIRPEDLLPGIERLLRTIKEHNISTAVASASKNAPDIIEQLGISDFFDYVVDASKIEKGKPDPEIFITAADFLKVPYSECIGVEDAAAGVEAIKKANMFSVGVGSKDHLSAADYIVSTTSELDFKKIVREFSEKKRK